MGTEYKWALALNTVHSLFQNGTFLLISQKIISHDQCKTGLYIFFLDFLYLCITQ